MWPVSGTFACAKVSAIAESRPTPDGKVSAAAESTFSPDGRVSATADSSPSPDGGFFAAPEGFAADIISNSRYIINQPKGKPSCKPT